MTKVIVLGGSGMLGSMVVDAIRREPDFKVVATVRSPAIADRFRVRAPDIEWRLFDGAAADTNSYRAAIDGANWVINAIGITKPYAHDDNPAEVENAIRINSMLPYDLAAVATEAGAQVLQIATDCVYSGQTGHYSEADSHDPRDVYGKTKSLGEVLHPGTYCLRCSIIGPEPKSYAFLIEWFRRQPLGALVKGFVNHEWNGITTLQFAKLCIGVIKEKIPLPHVQHVVPSGTISKYDLLRVFGREFRRPDIQIEPTEAQAIIDRTLSTAFEGVNRSLWAAAGYADPPTVAEMVAELARFAYQFEEA